MLYEDEVYDCVVLDSGTELAELGWHHALMPHGVIAPAYMDGKSRWLPYETLATNLDQAIKNLVNLTNAAAAKRPKYVGVSWHVQPPKDDQVETVGEGQNRTTQRKESADNKGEGVEYEGKVLPMIRGGFRRKLTAQLDTVVFTDILYTTRPEGAKLVTVPRFVIQVQPDPERHAKLPGPLAPMKYIDNNFKALHALVMGGKSEAAQTAAPAAAGKTRLR